MEVRGGVMVSTSARNAEDLGFESPAQPTHIFLVIFPLEGNISTTFGGDIRLWDVYCILDDPGPLSKARVGLAKLL